MKKIIKVLLVASIVILTYTIVTNQLAPKKNDNEYNVSYTRFIRIVKNEGIFKARLQGNNLWALAKTGEEFNIYVPDDPQLINDLLQNNVDLKVIPPERRSFWLELLLAITPILILIVAWFYFMKRQSNGGKFGKSNAKLLVLDENNKTLFSDVAGCDEAKEEVQEIVEFLKNPEKFSRLGGRIPKGILLTGEPGVGKTILAKAIAHEAEVPFYSISGSDFVEMFVGVGASRVRDMFKQAKENSPCIIFIDEIDAIGKSRTNSIIGNDERDQTLNALLVEMDGFSSDSAVIVIAATNRPEVLDSALLRPGRFDRQVSLNLPSLKGRVQILEVHTKNIPLLEDVDLETLAKGTVGFSGAELSSLVNEAVIFASKEGLDSVPMFAFDKAKDKLLMGNEKRSFVMSDHEKLTTAYHEAGHALISLLLDYPHDPIYKVSILPRGNALGITMFLPEDDQISISKERLLGQICSLYGGRAAEIILNKDSGVTTGCSNDISRATYLATKMVTEWGMGISLPLMNTLDYNELSQPSSILSELIESDIFAILLSCNKKTTKLLKANQKQLKLLANQLLLKETLSYQEIQDLLNDN